MASLLDTLAARIPVLAKARFNNAVKSEMQAVDAAIAARPPAPAPAMVSLDENKAVWKIKVPGKDDCFMSLTSGMNDQSRHVVMVDADKFYRAWLARATPASEHGRVDQCLLRKDMPTDYKYAGAVDGFKRGRENPVPLAECYGAKDDAGGTRVTFTNGVTRSFWLLANKAESFPVVTDSAAAAQELHRAAGVGSGPVTVSALFHQARQSVATSEATPASKPAPTVAIRPMTPKPTRSRGSRL